MAMLWQPSLSEHYTRMDPAEADRLITERKARLGDRVVLLGHHYQVDEVIEHADLIGDSLKLSQQAAAVAIEKPVEHIIFCGVHFMAETADILTPDHVEVILPDLSAGCSMADMADYEDTVDAWETLHAELDEQARARGESGWHGRIIPITYVNSTAAIKAFVGDHGGACCTSSNADLVFDWAIRGGDIPAAEGEEIKILFLPDQHLGRNTADKHGIDVRTQAFLYDPKRARKGDELGGMSPEQLADARVVLWAGHCSVHKLFRPEHCDDIRNEDAARGDGVKTTILVHPECDKAVVDKADLSGSTEYILKAVRDAEPGSRWAIGTEVHLVNRLAKEAAQRDVHVRILSDCQCLCTTMYRIDRPHLLWVLDGLCGLAEDGSAIEPIARNVVSVHPEAQVLASKALDRMLALTAHQQSPVAASR